MSSPLVWIGWVAASIYAVAMSALVLYGVHTLWLLAVFLRHRKKLLSIEKEELERPLPDELPRVLVQLPVYNERDVVARLLEAIGDLDWPADRLTIQLLDDSTDDSTEIGVQAVQELRARGLDAHHVCRESRVGFKAGALEHGMSLCDAPYIAIFDADFVPHPDFLKRAIRPFLDDSMLALVQGRWDHLNREDNLLTRAQAMGIDAHFSIEQCARSRGGLFMNFNGTCGLWKRDAIIDAGGWEHDTLTEDLDLSYRAQLKGWHCTYRLGLSVPGELPGNIPAWRSQQFRWAKGSMQCARKLLPTVFRSPVSWKAKFAALLHTTHYAVHPLMLLSLIVAPIAVWLCPAPPTWILMVGLLGFLLGMFAPIIAYLVSQLCLHPDKLWSRMASIPALAGIGTGIALSNGRAVFEAWRGVVSPFVRTPKQGDGAGSYRASRSSGVPEILAGAWACVGIGLAASAGRYWILPLLGIYASGFLWVGGRLAHQALMIRVHEAREREHRLSNGLLLGIGALSFCVYAWMGTQDGIWRQRPFLWASAGLGLGAAYLSATWIVRRFSLGPWGMLIIVLAGLGFRIASVGIHPSDDLNRYVVEGQQMAAGLNPYSIAPGDSQTDSALAGRLDTGILEAVNHPEWPAIYPPVSLAGHMLVSHIDPSLLAVKIYYGLIEVAAQLLLLALLLRIGLPAAFWLLSWWNPIGPMWFSGEGHNDALMVLWIVLALWLFARKYPRGSLMALSLGALSKPFAVVAMIPQLCRSPWKRWLIPPAMATVAYLPFLGAGRDVFHSLGRFGSEMHFHGALEPWVRYFYSEVVGVEALRDVVVASLVGLFLLGSFAILRRRPDVAGDDKPMFHTMGRLLAWLLLCLPTLHPWYLILILPFLPLLRRPWGMLLWTAMAPVYYLHGVKMLENGGTWIEDPMVTLAAHLPALLVLAWEVLPKGGIGGDVLPESATTRSPST